MQALIHPSAQHFLLPVHSLSVAHVAMSVVQRSRGKLLGTAGQLPTLLPLLSVLAIRAVLPEYKNVQN